MNTRHITADFPDLDKVEALAKEAFPPEEYLSPRELIEMDERGEVEFLGLYDEDTFIGFMVICLYGSICYLFFLAVSSQYRSRGYGSQALNYLSETYSDRQQIVDFEMIDKSATNNEQRIKRKAFYLRNGYKETGKFISYLGVDYEILCKTTCFDFEEFKQMMASFKIKGFAPEYFED